MKLYFDIRDIFLSPRLALSGKKIWIFLRANISGYKRPDRQVIIHKPDIGQKEIFSLDDLDYNKPRDYFKSAINVCNSEGLEFTNGFECEIKSSIPIQAGTSSSSAITVSWIHFLSYMADEKVVWSKQKLGELAFRTEVVEFQEPGGMMDQYTTAIGDLVYICLLYTSDAADE